MQTEEAPGVQELRLSVDRRHGRNTQFALADLLRQSVYSRIAGYEDVNVAERLSQDPTFRLIGSEKIRERGAALTSRLQTFQTDPRLIGSRSWARKLCSAPTRPWPCRRSTRRWKSGA